MPHNSHSTNPDSSTDTLINPPPPTRLLLANPNPLITILRHKNLPRYMISTLDPSGAKTIISDLRPNAKHPETLMMIQRRMFGADEITFVRHERLGRKVKTGKWLRESRGRDGGRWDIETSEGCYTWRTDPFYRVVLYPASDMKTPIAWMELQSNEPTQLVLVVNVPLEDQVLWDIVIGGWVLVEERLRLEERIFPKPGPMGDVRA